MKNLLWLVLGALTVQTSLHAVVDPSELKLKVYAIYLSTDPYCSNPRALFTTTSPVYSNFLGSPTLGSIDNADGSWNGTYHCVIIKMSDNIKYTPTANEGGCTAGTEYTADVCRSENTTDNAGVTTACSTSENISYLHLSTASTNAGGGGGGGSSWQAPTAGDLTMGLTLSGAFTIAGSSTGTFVVNGLGKVEDNFGDCDMQPPTFSFR